MRFEVMDFRPHVGIRVISSKVCTIWGWCVYCACDEVMCIVAVIKLREKECVDNERIREHVGLPGI
jgi:hypothetical protein